MNGDTNQNSAMRRCMGAGIAPDYAIAYLLLVYRCAFPREKLVVDVWTQNFRPPESPPHIDVFTCFSRMYGKTTTTKTTTKTTTLQRRLRRPLRRHKDYLHKKFVQFQQPHGQAELDVRLVCASRVCLCVSALLVDQSVCPPDCHALPTCPSLAHVLTLSMS